MFRGFTQETSDFFWELQFNNERPWFAAHRDMYERAVHEPFSALADDTLALMREKYPSVQWSMHVSRIYRDARRLFGRGPYKDHLWFSLRDDARMSEVPMLWFEIGAGDFGRGCGFWTATPTQMGFYRRRIDANVPAFEEMVRSLTHDGHFRTAMELYKRPKRDCGEALNPWYNCKRPGVEHIEPFGGDALSAGLPQILVRDFGRLMPYYKFLCACCE